MLANAYLCVWDVGGCSSLWNIRKVFFLANGRQTSVGFVLSVWVWLLWVTISIIFDNFFFNFQYIFKESTKKKINIFSFKLRTARESREFVLSFRLAFLRVSKKRKVKKRTKSTKILCKQNSAIINKIKRRIRSLRILPIHSFDIFLFSLPPSEPLTTLSRIVCWNRPARFH